MPHQRPELIAQVLRAYPPVSADSPRRQPTGDPPDLPPDIQTLIEGAGYGKLADGLFELVRPTEYAAAYAAFFGGDAQGRAVWLLNAFGELVTVKAISPREQEFAILRPYGPQLEVLGYHAADVLERVLLTDDGLRSVVNLPLFRQLHQRLGRLREGQVYGFDPDLLRQERERDPERPVRADASWFEVVDAGEHLGLLLVRAGEE